MLLLHRIDEFPDSVLVTGCQRSGTTALARAINASPAMVDYRFGRDDELDAAQILAGRVDHVPRGRYCFQTTYLNQCYGEYLEHRSPQRIVWVLRNPYSVVYSMVYNWGRFAFNELFAACGSPLLEGWTADLYRWFAAWQCLLRCAPVWPTAVKSASCSSCVSGWMTGP